MIKNTFKWTFVILLVFLIAPISYSWSGAPPADIVFYGYAYINGSIAPAGTNISILSNSESLVMDSGTIGAGGYFPGVTMSWDDPDTGIDEGITYSNNAESIRFKLNGETVEYPLNTYVLQSEAGNSIEITLDKIHNFEPELYTIQNVTIDEDSLLSFDIFAIDDNSFRNDTLTFSENSPGTLSSTSKIYPSNNTWRSSFSWTPTNSNVGTYDYTFSVTDNGIPQKSDTQLVRIIVNNVNDAPNINLLDQSTYSNMEFTYDISNVCSDIDPTADTLSYFDNTTDFDIDKNTGIINFTPTVPGNYNYEITCCDDSMASNNCSSDTFELTVSELTGIVIVKNIHYIAQDAENITYKIEDTVYNFLGYDIFGVTLNDSDAGIYNVFNLSDESYMTFTGYFNFSKQQNDTEYLFSRAQVVANSTPFFSNQPKVIMPGYGSGDFDISIQPISNQCPNSNFNVIATLANQDNSSGGDYAVRWFINNSLGTLLYSGSKTVRVEANETINTTLTSISPSNIGSYIFSTYVVADPNATASGSFNVISCSTPPSGGGGGGGGSSPRKGYDYDDDKSVDEDFYYPKDDSKEEPLKEDKEEELRDERVPEGQEPLNLVCNYNLFWLLIIILILLLLLLLYYFIFSRVLIIMDTKTFVDFIKTKKRFRYQIKSIFKTKYKLAVTGFTYDKLKKESKKDKLAKEALWAIREFEIKVIRVKAKGEFESFRKIERIPMRYILTGDIDLIKYLPRDSNKVLRIKGGKVYYEKRSYKPKDKIKRKQDPLTLLYRYVREQFSITKRNLRVINNRLEYLQEEVKDIEEETINKKKNLKSKDAKVNNKIKNKVNKTDSNNLNKIKNKETNKSVKNSKKKNNKIKKHKKKYKKSKEESPLEHKLEELTKKKKSKK